MGPNRWVGPICTIIDANQKWPMENIKISLTLNFDWVGSLQYFWAPYSKMTRNIRHSCLWHKHFIIIFLQLSQQSRAVHDPRFHLEKIKPVWFIRPSDYEFMKIVLQNFSTKTIYQIFFCLTDNVFFVWQMDFYLN